MEGYMMFALAFAKEGNSDMIRLKTYEIDIFYSFRNIITSNEIDEGLSRGIVDESLEKLYDKEQLKQDGIFMLYDGSNKQVIWQDKSVMMLDSVRIDLLQMNNYGFMIFNKVTLISEESLLPDFLALTENEQLELEIRYFSNDVSKLKINFSGKGCFSTEGEGYKILISKEMDKLKIYIDEYLFSFKVYAFQSTVPQDSYLEKKNIEDELHLKNLFVNIKLKLKELESLLDEVNSHWVYEDCIYRLYHQSLKVYAIQKYTLQIIDAIKDLLPGEPLNRDFNKIIEMGTGKKFKLEDNLYWLIETVPMTTAFLHAKYMLEMIVKYGRKLDSIPEVLPSGWASVLSLYNLR